MVAERLLDGLNYVLAAATVAVAATMLGPNTAQLQAQAYETLRIILATLFGSTHAKPVSSLPGDSTAAAPFGLLLSFLFVASASVMTILQVLSHLVHYVNPVRQRYVVRILLMVPIYAVDSFWSYLSYRDATWISIARDTYEAYVLYNFYALLMDFLGGEDGCVAAWRANSAKDPRNNIFPHSFPMNYILSPMVLSRNLLWWWKALLVQYMLLSPLITVLTFVSGAEGVFDENSYALDNAHVYLMVLKTVSVTLAFTALFYLYLSTKKIMHDYHPTGKFISIKFVIFFSFWQYIVITTAHSYGVIPSSWLQRLLAWSHDTNTLEDQEVALCNILLCIEMFVTAVMHHHVFSCKATLAPTAEGERKQVRSGNAMPFAAAVKHAFAVHDIWSTTVVTAKEAQSKAKKRQ